VISFLFIIKANLQKLFLNKKIYFKKNPRIQNEIGGQQTREGILFP